MSFGEELYLRQIATTLDSMLLMESNLLALMCAKELHELGDISGVPGDLIYNDVYADFVRKIVLQINNFLKGNDQNEGKN